MYKPGMDRICWERFTPLYDFLCITFSYFHKQIALLCGPPGLGKTTLAHIIAKHAGYNVVEMNARWVGRVPGHWYFLFLHVGFKYHF